MILMPSHTWKGPETMIKFVTDSYFETGTGHAICEDYAISGEYKGLYYAIGADGCSSSKNTDMGARLLCHIAKKKIMYMHFLGAFAKSSVMETERMLRVLITEEISKVNHSFSLETSSFDATLWIALVSGSNVFVMGWGDGVVIQNRKRIIQVTKYEYESNAPYYLSYGLSHQRQIDYADEFADSKIFCSDMAISNGKKECYTQERKCDAPFLLYMDRSESPLISISICSDGVNSYQDAENKQIPLGEISTDYVAYKNYTGEFVKRRMSRLRKDCEKAGLHHIDDVFCATIYMGD